MEKINDLATGSIPANVSTATLQQTARNYNSFGWNVLPQDYKMPYQMGALARNSTD